MRKLHFFYLFILSAVSFAQNPIYVDNFDDNIISIAQSSAFDFEIVDNNLEISGNGSGGMWAAMTYTMHDAGVSKTIDLSVSPKLYIKAKANQGLEFRIDLQDETGYVTNLQATSVNIGTSFAVYEFDFTGKFLDGAFGGPCTNGPCVVNSSKITNLSIFARPGVGAYTGKITIDWLSIGAPFEEGAQPSNYEIRYNQVGYFVDRTKILSVNSAQPFANLNYTIKNNSDVVVANGTTGASILWADAQEHVAHIDFTSVNLAGEYVVEIDDVKETITIGEEVYEDLAKAAFKYYYFNRASISVTAEFGDKWTRTTGIPDTNVRVHSSAATSARPVNTRISSSGGWYDAGDYNKYVVNSGISTYTLLAAYEHFPEYYGSKDFNIPESSNNLPDILDEAFYNLDWMLTMQDPNDGGVYHKLTGLGFSGIVMPNQYNLERYVVKKSTAAALNFAAVAATAARIMTDFETQKPGYKAKLITAAKSAYAWALANPNVFFTNPSDVVTGEYGDTNLSDEFLWAATELFITTKENIYKNAVNVFSMNNQVPNWQSVSALALYSINHHASKIASDINTTEARKRLLLMADILENNVNNSAMKTTMAQNDYVWGSNGVAGNQVLYLIRAYELTQDDKYLNAAYIAMDYLLGRNGTGFSFVTGFGTKTPMNPHHRISEADNIADPVPGMLAGGPQPGQQDDCAYPSSVRAKSYSETWCSYASNEVTINWNSPLMYAVNALQNYQNKGAALSVANESEKDIVDLIQLYPNPTKDKLFVNSGSRKIKNVSIYSIQGKLVFSANNNAQEQLKSIDVSNLNTGIYFVKLATDNGFITRRILKK
ncbi:glycoside hydrolase family 9 protein [uncultured Polaribacter sp.]|uniref:glycoside hydrolase family 9 protein n=1 Tax=uncultured Polaribacter sp. TaxID=174711 RepID=UPI00261FEC70|nr:glycoside hydrolase family 9 protein [uncultured Polaribacter sp.]